ncbi:MAG: ASPIC/UnbV domain-containing protein, partial [Planctomycetota bacterium]
GGGAGVGFDATGAPRGAMGVDRMRFEADGAQAIAIGNFSTEMTALYTATPGSALFADDAAAAGLGAITRPDLTFGVLWADLDLDGRPELIAANGHLEPHIARVQPGISYEQPPRIFWNAGDDAGLRFQALTAAEVGEDFVQPFVGRAVAAAGVDLDGDLDLLFTCLGGRPRLFRNEQSLGRRWLRVTVAGSGQNTGALGATVSVTGGGRTQIKTVQPTRGYLTQIELPLSFGLGSATRADSVRVRWPGGVERTFDDIDVDRSIQLGRPETGETLTED